MASLLQITGEMTAIMQFSDCFLAYLNKQKNVLWIVIRIVQNIIVGIKHLKFLGDLFVLLLIPIGTFWNNSEIEANEIKQMFACCQHNKQVTTSRDLICVCILPAKQCWETMRVNSPEQHCWL